MELKQPSQFKQKWEANKLLNKAKKNAKKKLESQGLTPKQASSHIKQALKRISKDEDPNV
jgi:hypothetical protein